MTDERIAQAFEIIRKYEIKSASFNMVGFPGDHGAIQETIALNQRIKPDLIQHTIFYPYRGTALGDLAHREGYVVRNGYPTYFGRGTLDLPRVPAAEIERQALLFDTTSTRAAVADAPSGSRAVVRTALSGRVPSVKKVLITLNLWALRPMAPGAASA